MKHILNYSISSVFIAALLLGHNAPAQAAAVKSLGRANEIEINGKPAKEYIVTCSNRQQRPITKLNEDKLWCSGDEENACHVNKLKAAQKACSRKVSRTDSNSLAAQTPDQTNTKSAPSSQENNQQARETLNSELQKVQLEQQRIRAQIDSLEQQRKALIDGRDER